MRSGGVAEEEERQLVGLGMQVRLACMAHDGSTEVRVDICAGDARRTKGRSENPKAHHLPRDCEAVSHLDAESEIADGSKCAFLACHVRRVAGRTWVLPKLGKNMVPGICA
jgi:hypothetical protein